LNKTIHLAIQSTNVKIKQCLKSPVGLLWQPWLARVDTYEHNCTCRLYYGMVTQLLTTRRFTVYIFLKNVLGKILSLRSYLRYINLHPISKNQKQKQKTEKSPGDENNSIINLYGNNRIFRIEQSENNS
jgi:hypothetical protein